MDYYTVLIEKTSQERDYLLSAPVISAVFEKRFDLATYTEFLTQAYHHVKHTVPLMMACGARLSSQYEWLREVLSEYIKEEIGHQEWILDDIEQCGGNKDIIRDTKPELATQLMISYVYDYIHRINPVGFFGMVLVLEGTSIQLASQVAEVAKTHLGLKKSAFRYLTTHGHVDMEHIEFLKSVVNRLTTESDQKAVTEVAKVVYHLYGDILRSLPYLEK